MSNWKIEKYLTQPKAISDLIFEDSTIVIFDTNVLLSAYQWRNVTLKQIWKVLEDLYEKGRLKFSLQTIKEFSINRNRQIQNRINDLDMEINKLTISKPIIELVPIIEGTKYFKEADSKQKIYLDAQKEYKNQLKDMKSQLINLFFKDDFLDFLKIISSENIISVHSDEKLLEVQKEANRRFAQNIPPGYKDSKKETNNYGDFIIWDDMLSLKKDIIFVSNDTKKDWVDIKYEGKICCSNPLLIQEFLEKTDGKSFVQVTPQDLIQYWNPEVEHKIVEDLLTVSKRNNELSREDIISKLRKAGLSYYPGMITEAVFNIGPEQVLSMDDVDLKESLDDYFMEEMINLSKIDFSNEGKYPGNLRKVLSNEFDLVNLQVTEKLLNTARNQAKEYLANLVINDFSKYDALET